MKHTAHYPHQRHQNLARLLLTIWLFTICSPEATCSPTASQPEQVVSAAVGTNFCPPELPGSDTALSNASQLPLEAALQQMPPDSFLDEKNERKFYKEMGDLAWQQAMDCDDALKKQWDRLTILKREDLAHLSAVQLEALRLKYAIKAHELYSVSCQEAAKAQDLSNETELKATMAGRLLTLGYPLEAKIYVLNILLRLKSASSDIEVGALRRAQALLAKVEEAQSASPDGQTATNSPTSTLSTTLQKLNEHREHSPAATQEDYADLEIQVKWAVAQDLREIARKLLLSVYNPRSPLVSEATISSMQKLGERYKQTARNTIIVGGLGILAIVGKLCTRGILNFCDLFELREINFVDFLWEHCWAVGYAYMAFGANFVLIRLGHDLAAVYALPLWEEGESRKEKAEACSTLNPIIAKALEVYRQGNVQRSINILFENQQILLLEKMNSYFPQNYISDTLQQHGFGLDVIAWVINVIGEGWLLGLSIPGDPPGCWQWEARENFQYALRLVSLELKKLAQRRNKRVIESLIDLRNRYRQTWKRFCELANRAWEEFLWVLFGDPYGAGSVTDTLKKWRRSTIMAIEALEDVQERSPPENLETVRMIVETNLPIAQMAVENTYMGYEGMLRETHLENKKKLPDQLVKAACDAMKHYLQLQRNSDAMPPLLRAAITDLTAATEADALAPSVPDQ